MTTVDIDGENASDGLMALVLAVIEILIEAMEREAVRRMESGTLTDEEIERLGGQLAALEEEIEGLKAETETTEAVDDFRGELDGLVAEFIDRNRHYRTDHEGREVEHE